MSDGLLYGNAGQLGWQALAAVAAPAYAFVATFVILRLIGLVMPLRATEREEAWGWTSSSTARRPTPTGEGAILVSAPDLAEIESEGAVLASSKT